MYITRSMILESDDLQRGVVECPEWGGPLLVRGLTAGERDRFESELLEMHGKTARLKLDHARASLVSKGAINEDGSHIFTMADVKALGDKSGAVVDRVANAIRALSGLSDTDMTEIIANFTIAPPSDSVSG